tara:strand:+ start:2715 stop:3059 length:345 start_codon:yes stop_codon:yes gene_type:complete
MELVFIIAVVVIGGYLVYKRYTKDVMVNEQITTTEEAPYKAEPSAVAEVDATKDWPFPTTSPDNEVVSKPAAITAKKAKAPAKPKAAPKPAAPVKAKAPAKPKAVKATAAKPKK